MRPAATVLMAVYNGEPYLDAAVESIRNQTYGDYEFLVVDDGSTDRTPDILRRASQLDARLRVLTNTTNRGLPAALNLGLREARAPFVFRQDADDVSLPQRLAHQLGALESAPEVACVGSWYDLLDDEGIVFGRRSIPCDGPTIVRNLMSGTNYLAHGSVALRREAVLQAGGYDERFWFSQDFDLWLRMLGRNPERVCAVPLALYQLRQTAPQSRFKEICQQRYTQEALRLFKGDPRDSLSDVRAEARGIAAGEAVTHQSRFWVRLGYMALEQGFVDRARRYITRAATSGGAERRVLLLRLVAGMPSSPRMTALHLRRVIAARRDDLW